MPIVGNPLPLNAPRWRTRLKYLGLRTLLGLGGLLLTLGLAFSMFWGYIVLPACVDDHTAHLVHIESGMSTLKIGELLESRRLIRNKWAFVLLCRALGLEGKLIAGSYSLTPAMNMPQVLDRLLSGSVATVRVTVFEGFTAKDIARLLQAKDLVKAEDFLELVNNPERVFGDHPPLPLPHGSLEGYLFPDTYVFTYSHDAASILGTMVGRFMEVALPLLQAKASRFGLTVHEALALASIIEKEAVLDEERPIISGVFHNRMRIGMPLQSDPTLLYLFDGRKKKLYYSDLEIKSRYNTYKYPGLPPGPICSPGMASIQAALEPEEVDYLYFVARGDGTHAFSRTFAEHVAARRRYGY